jgi:hypothetical protein
MFAAGDLSGGFTAVLPLARPGSACSPMCRRMTPSFRQPVIFAPATNTARYAGGKTVIVEESSLQRLVFATHRPGRDLSRIDAVELLKIDYNLLISKQISTALQSDFASLIRKIFRSGPVSTASFRLRAGQRHKGVGITP